MTRLDVLLKQHYEDLDKLDTVEEAIDRALLQSIEDPRNMFETRFSIWLSSDAPKKAVEKLISAYAYEGWLIDVTKYPDVIISVKDNQLFKEKWLEFLRKDPNNEVKKERAVKV